MMIDNIDIDYAEIKKKMKPCPFCGNTITVCSYEYSSDDDFTQMHLGCNKCGAGFDLFGSKHGFAKSAMKLWNMRANK